MCFLESTQMCMYLSTDLPQTVSHLSLSSLSMLSSFWLSSFKEVLSFRARPVRLVVSYTECLLPRAFWNSYAPPHKTNRGEGSFERSSRAHVPQASCEALREAWCHRILPFVFVTDSSEHLKHCWAVNYTPPRSTRIRITQSECRPLVPRFKTTDAAHHLWLRSLTSGLKNCNWKTSNISVCLLQCLALCDLKSWPL